MDKEYKFKKGELKELILKILGFSVIVGGILITPNAPIIIGIILSLIKEMKKVNVSAQKVRRVLQVLEKEEILFLEQKEHDVFVHIKEIKNSKLLRYSIQGLLDFKLKQHKWNKKWYLVIFDVPEIQKNKRQYLRRFLINIGFYQYQKSVYIFPYACKKEVELIKQMTKSNKYLHYIIAEEIENESDLRRYFKL